MILADLLQVVETTFKVGTHETTNRSNVAATNRFVCTVKRQVIRAHCSDRLQRQIALV